MDATLAVMTALALVLAACGGGSNADDPSPLAQKPIRIGTKNFTEQYILGELYSQALEAKGFMVEIQGQDRQHGDHASRAQRRGA